MGVSSDLLAFPSADDAESHPCFSAVLAKSVWCCMTSRLVPLLFDTMQPRFQCCATAGARFVKYSIYEFLYGGVLYVQINAGILRRFVFR
jgi:hypothetical protein